MGSFSLSPPGRISQPTSRHVLKKESGTRPLSSSLGPELGNERVHLPAASGFVESADRSGQRRDDLPVFVFRERAQGFRLETPF